MTATPLLINTAIDLYCRKLERLSGNTVTLADGRKFIKVVTDDGTQRSVHSFVEKTTGNLYKAASWNAPAKGVRYNLVQDWDMLDSIMDQHGAYLYQDMVKTVALSR